MGLLDKFTGDNKKKKKKYAPKSADERLKLTKVRALSKFLRENPDYTNRLAIEEFGLGEEQKKGEIAALVEQFELLKRGGFVENPQNLRGGAWGGFTDLARAFGEGIGEAMKSKFDPAAMMGSPTVQTEQPRQVYLPQPQREYAPQIVQRDTSQATQPQTGEGKMDLEARLKIAYLIGNLEGRSPEDAAQWLLAQADQNRDVMPFVVELCNTPDSELSSKVADLTQRYPQVAPMANWFLSHEDKAKQIIWAMRQQFPQSDESEAPAASAMGI